MKKLTIIIPCHNEALGIANVLRDIPYDRLANLKISTHVIVVDNNSTDNTATVAKSFGVTVISEKKKGKGNAIKTGFTHIDQDSDFVVMLDGDDTYKASEIIRLIEPLDSGFCDVIVGSRLGGKINDGSFKFANRVVNWGYAFLVRQFYRANITDVLSGFFAWKKTALDGLSLHLESDGFAIEMEMITKMVKLGYSIFSVPITYDRRLGESKIESVRDGLRILKMFFQNLSWQPGKNKKHKLAIRINLFNF